MERRKEAAPIATGMATDSQSAASAQDAVGFLRRRKWIFLFVAIPIVLGSIVLAYKLPSIYQSEAKVLIEQPSIPDDIVASTITSYIDERIQAVSQRVLAADNVTRLIKEFDLYADLRGDEVNQTVIQLFRDDVEQQNIAAEIFDARRGRMDGSTFAFTIAFRHSDPQVARDVTSSLVQLYLEENQKSRSERSAETTQFLQEQADRIAGDISQFEIKLADFKAQYAGAMPERLQLNVQLLDRTERDLADVDDEVRRLTSDRDILRFELKTIDPYATLLSTDGAPVMGAQERLQALRLEYTRLTSTYGPEHPDVVRTRREIESILGTADFESVEDIERQLVLLREQRSALIASDRYSTQHPDVQKLDRTIASLEDKKIVAASRPSTSSQMPAPNNPEYVQKKIELDGVTSQLYAARSNRQKLSASRNELETNIAIAPRVEKEWLELNRGYDSTRSEFEEINKRISDAKMSQRLETENKGERFTLLERATLPAAPIEPNRFAIIFLGSVLAVGCGLGLAALMDGVDSTVRSSRDLEAMLGSAPLVAIPFVETAKDRRLRLIRHSSVAVGFVLSLAVVFATVQ